MFECVHRKNLKVFSFKARRRTPPSQSNRRRLLCQWTHTGTQAMSPFSLTWTTARSRTGEATVESLCNSPLGGRLWILLTSSAPSSRTCAPENKRAHDRLVVSFGSNMEEGTDSENLYVAVERRVERGVDTVGKCEGLRG